MVEFIGEAAKALPQLIEQLEIGLAPSVDVHLLMKQAEAFAEGDPEAESLTGSRCACPPRARAGRAGRPRRRAWIPCSPTSSSRRCAATSR